MQPADTGSQPSGTGLTPAEAPRSSAFRGWLPGSLLILKQQVATEGIKCWILVALAALAAAWVSLLIGEYSLGTVGLFLAALADTASQQTGYAPQIASLFTGLINIVLSIGLMVFAPLAIVLLAIWEYRRSYRLTAGDLVWGDLALFLMHDEYGLIIEQARVERFRLNPNPVELGENLSQRLQHFAAYYPQYRRLAQPVAGLKLPTVMERNCWADGGLVIAGACLSTCCIGLVIALPMIARIAGGWPRQVAIKQAVIHFFEGRFDQALEDQWLSQSDK